MSRPSSSKNSLVVWVIVALGITAVYVFAVSYLLSENRAIVEASREADFLIQRELKIRSLGSTLDAIELEGEKLKTYFIDSRNRIQFLENIEELGESLGVDVEVVSLGEEEFAESIDGEASEDLRTVFLSIRVQGEWPRVFHYLSLIETLPSAVDVHSIELEQASVGDTTVWTLSLDISVLKLLNSK
jgi:Tfp pilus assembly protein PilO